MTLDPTQLRIVHYPEPILRKRAQRLDSIDENVRAVAIRMIELMYEHEGVGLAAPQVDLPWQMFVTMPPEEAREQAGPNAGVVFINPVIQVEKPAPEVMEEGCLSLPGIRTDIRRPIGVTITAQNLDGEMFSQTRDDFMARVWQHEFDHLNGVLIIDRMKPMARLALRKAIKELEASGVER